MDCPVSVAELPRERNDRQVTAALFSLMQCDFSPAVVNGHGIESTARVEYVWRLE